MKQTYHIHILESTEKIAKEAGIQLAVPNTTEITREITGEAIPDKIGIYLGKCVNGVYTSIIEGDDEECTKLKKYMELGIVHTKIFNQVVDKDLCDIPHYFILYNVDESSANIPTYTEESCGIGTSVDGHYVCEYEVLLGSDGYTRRMVFKTSSVNISMYEWFHDLEDEINDLDEACDEIKEQFFKSTDEELWQYTMFDDIGSPANIELDSDEFLSMIVGIRQLSCEFVEN